MFFYLFTCCIKLFNGESFKVLHFFWVINYSKLLVISFLNCVKSVQISHSVVAGYVIVKLFPWRETVVVKALLEHNSE